jgi:hypothetical protein
MDAQVTDGTNTWAPSSTASLSLGQGLNANDFSPVTYGNGASVTLTLQARCVSLNGTIALTSSSALAMKTTLKALFVAAN